MLMLVTGKNTEVVQTSVDKRQLRRIWPKILRIIFLLGEGEALAQKMGIKDVSIIYDKDVAGIGVKKEVTDFLDVGYQVEKKGYDRSQTADLKHTLGAELKLNSHISVEVDETINFIISNNLMIRLNRMIKYSSSIKLGFNKVKF